MSKKRTFRILASGVVAALSLSLAACGDTPSADAGDGSYSGILPIYTPRQGGSAYILGGGIANETSKTIDNMQGTVEATTGTQEMLQRLQQRQDSGQPAFALPDTTGAVYAINGEEPFGEPYPDIQALGTVQTGVIYMVARKDSGYESLADLEGATLGMGVSGSVVNYLTKDVLEAHGLSEGDYNEQPLGYDEVADGLSNGSIDAGVLAGSEPVAALTELAAQHDVTIIEPDAEIMEALRAESPYVLDWEVEGGLYQGIDNPLQTFGFSVALVTHKDTPDDLVTSMMELVFDRTDQLVKVHASAGNITPENATRGISFDFHPAAADYLAQHGVEVSTSAQEGDDDGDNASDDS